MNRYEVYPHDGAGAMWGFRLVDEDGNELPGGRTSVGTRGETIRACKEARGDKTEEHFRADGESVGEVVLHRGPEAIVLMRPDGSLYGELDHALGNGGTPQRVTLTPAVVGDTATEVGA